MRTMVKKAISLILIVQGLVLVTNVFSFELYINIQVAFLSALFIILGASFTYKRMVDSKLVSQEFEDERDLLDTIEDPHELYDNTIPNETAVEELDLKEIVKEEKAKIKTLSIKSMKHGVRGSVSAYRLVPYLFLILGFIALKNNELLNIGFYLPSLFLGILVASISSKTLFTQ